MRKWEGQVKGYTTRTLTDAGAHKHCAYPLRYHKVLLKATETSCDAGVRICCSFACSVLNPCNKCQLVITQTFDKKIQASWINVRDDCRYAVKPVLLDACQLGAAKICCSIKVGVENYNFPEGKKKEKKTSVHAPLATHTPADTCRRPQSARLVRTAVHTDRQIDRTVICREVHGSAAHVVQGRKEGCAQAIVSNDEQSDGTSRLRCTWFEANHGFQRLKALTGGASPHAAQPSCQFFYSSKRDLRVPGTSRTVRAIVAIEVGLKLRPKNLAVPHSRRAERDT